MTVYCYLDDVKDEDGGALYFARARPGAVRVRVRKGLAAIFYSALEDGTLDRTAAHGDAPLRPGAEAWVLALRVYDRPRPLARRVILPAVLWLPFGGAPPKALAVASYRFFARAVGDEKAPAAVDAALWALAALLFAPLGVAAFLAYKAFEKSRARSLVIREETSCRSPRSRRAERARSCVLTDAPRRRCRLRARHGGVRRVERRCRPRASRG